jgi:type IV secretory pathway TrbF-like protein
MPASPSTTNRNANTPADGQTDANTPADANPTPATTTRTRRTNVAADGAKTNASKIILGEITSALTAGVRVYGSDPVKLSEYILRQAGQVQAAAEAETDQQAADFRVITRMLHNATPPADAKPATPDTRLDDILAMVSKLVPADATPAS